MNPPQDFLLEIGTEELPPNDLEKLAQALANNIEQQLISAKLEFTAIKYYATPRRLAVAIENLASKQPNQIIERRGPAVESAYDADGYPTPATLGFAKSCGVSPEELKQIENEKGSWLCYQQQSEGAKTIDLLPNIIQLAVTTLPITRLMRWDSLNAGFVRPVHWILAIYGNKVINLEMFDIKSDNKSHGHRFHCPHIISISKIEKYTEELEECYVIADFDQRKQKIKQQIETVSAKYGKAKISEQLLNEVTGIVEWPVALLGSFPQHYLQLPAEVLVTSMQKHQKCFPIYDKNDTLLPFFVVISNIESHKPEQVITGNERVINARLADAKFFFENDGEQPLTKFTSRLTQIVFQTKLGTMRDKTTRITELATFIAKLIGADTNNTKKAAELAKADLTTLMVGEFPDLQGVMGCYYATKSGEPTEVATAIREHYLPRFATDALPQTKAGIAVAIADRIDTLVGIFGINKPPSGTKDPFALRRAALGVLRIIIEKQLNLDLRVLITESINNYNIKFSNTDLCNQLLDFMLERLRAWYLEQNITPQIYAAVLALMPTNPYDFDKRIHAVSEFVQLPEAEALAIANKRVANILKKSDKESVHQKINSKLLVEPAEQHLAKMISEQQQIIAPLCNAGEYTKALKSLATLKTAVDNFFDYVMVMDEDQNLQNNRLALLNELRNLFLKAADISLL